MPGDVLTADNSPDILTCPPKNNQVLSKNTMCRWFAYISHSEPCLLEDVLVTPAHSLSKQVHDHYLPGLAEHEPNENQEATEKEIAMRNKWLNADGLGVTWYLFGCFASVFRVHLTGGYIGTTK